MTYTPASVMLLNGQLYDQVYDGLFRVQGSTAGNDLLTTDHPAFYCD